MTHGPALSSLRIALVLAFGMAVLATGARPVPGQTNEQTTSVVPTVPQKPAVPERIDPIVAPLPTAPQPIAKAGARAAAALGGPAAAAVTSKLPTCRPGERLLRKTGTCQAIVGTVAKSAAIKPAVAKPVATKPGATKPVPAKTVPAKTLASKASSQVKTAKTPAKRG